MNKRNIEFLNKALENTGCEPLVILKFFGPACNPDMPDK